MSDAKETTETKKSLFEGKEESIKAVRESADIFKETHTINLKPQYTDKVTEESLTEHVDFIRDSLAVAGKATSEIVHDYVAETKDSHHWTGNLALPGINNQFIITPSESFHNPETGKTEIEYGHHDLIMDIGMGEAHTNMFEEIHEIDQKRYESLFSSKE